MDPATAAVAGAEGYSTAHYVSIFSGALLAISELLPFLSKVKGNGIIQAAVQAFQKHEADQRKEQDQFDAILARLDKLVAIFENNKNLSAQ